MPEYEYFSPEADPALFTCSETGKTGIQPEFVLALDKLRGICGFPFYINSGYRSTQHSLEALKDKPGTHTRGIAADIQVTGSHNRFILIQEAMKMGFRGVGVAKGYIHLDMRDSVQVMWVY